MISSPNLALYSALSLVVGCQPAGPDEVPPDIDCDAVAVPAYAEVTIWPQCTNCHASTLSGADRRGATVGVDFDTYDAAVTFAEDAAIEVNIGNMPFTGTVTEEQKEELYAWALCGTP